MRIEPAKALEGHIGVPGDKSISHRALMYGAIGDGETVIRGFGRSADTEATASALRALGVTVHDDDVDTVRVEGVGLRGFREPSEPIDCGNSGTTIRLLAGLLAGQSGRFELTGDDSLRRRPMRRIAVPLAEMGARVETADGFPPFVVEGGALRGIRYELPVASAQVKSCILNAGLYAEGQDDRGRAAAHARPHRDHAGGRGRAGAAEAVARVAGAGREPASRRGRRAGRLLGRRAVRGRRDPASRARS